MRYIILLSAIVRPSDMLICYARWLFGSHGFLRFWFSGWHVSPARLTMLS